MFLFFQFLFKIVQKHCHFFFPFSFPFFFHFFILFFFHFLFYFFSGFNFSKNKKNQFINKYKYKSIDNAYRHYICRQEYIIYIFYSFSYLYWCLGSLAGSMYIFNIFIHVLLLSAIIFDLRILIPPTDATRRNHFSNKFQSSHKFIKH